MACVFARSTAPTAVKTSSSHAKSWEICFLKLQCLVVILTFVPISLSSNPFLSWQLPMNIVFLGPGVSGWFSTFKGRNEIRRPHPSSCIRKNNDSSVQTSIMFETTREAEVAERIQNLKWCVWRCQIRMKAKVRRTHDCEASAFCCRTRTTATPWRTISPICTGPGQHLFPYAQRLDVYLPPVQHWG